MKKIMMWILSGLSVVVLSGCGGGDGDYVPRDVHYLTDDLGYGVSGIYYECNSYYGTTDDYGAFNFNPDGDYCDFYLDNVAIDLYIMDEFSGVNGLLYDCYPSGIYGVTGDFMGDGGFDYEIGDICTIRY